MAVDSALFEKRLAEALARLIARTEDGPKGCRRRAAGVGHGYESF
jgi:hypothetical protein